MSEQDLAARLDAVSTVLARRMPAVLVATAALFEAMLAMVDLDARTERMLAAPVVLTAEQVLEVARARGVPAFGAAAGSRLILLASLGLDLTNPGIRAALLEMHRRRELRLAHIADVGAVRADLAARGLSADLVDESVISDGNTIFHAVAIP